MAVPASSVLLVTVGGILAYAGFTGRSPLEALKDLGTGSPAPLRNTSTVDPGSYASTAGGVGVDVLTDAYTDAVAGEGLPSLPAALMRFKGDKYSQLRRNQKGYSDCSSFVGKGLKVIGVKPPGPSTTTSFLASKEWKRIPSDDAQAGDVAVSLGHMITYITKTTGIGQQNPRANVKRGTVKELMYGNTPYVTLRYVGGTAAPKSSAT
jgi:hypothetical protein